VETPGLHPAHLDSGRRGPTASSLLTPTQAASSLDHLSYPRFTHPPMMLNSFIHFYFVQTRWGHVSSRAYWCFRSHVNVTPLLRPARTAAWGGLGVVYSVIHRGATGAAAAARPCSAEVPACNRGGAAHWFTFHLNEAPPNILPSATFFQFCDIKLT